MTSTHVLLEQPEMVQNYIYLSTLMTMIYWFLTQEDQDICPLEVVGQGLEDNADGSSDSSTEISEEEETEEQPEEQPEDTPEESKEDSPVRDYDYLSKVD